jgi:cell wall-associated NlpC family hydrolase
VIPEPWAAAYVGLPYRSLGRSRDGLDCWGLVRLVWADLFGVTVEGFEGGYADAADRARLDGLIRGELPFHPVVGAGAERPLDVVFFRQAGCVSHCGVICGAGLMLHAHGPAGVVVESYQMGVWGRRLFGIYRHRDVA